MDAQTEKAQCPATRRNLLVGIDVEQGRSYVFVPGCNMWNCPVCGAKNRGRWKARIFFGIEAYKNQGTDTWYFCTVTSHAKLRTFAATFAKWPKQWAKLSTRFRRYFGNPPYAFIPELHKNGRMHGHMLIGAEVTTKWLKHHAPQCGFGYEVDGEKIHQTAYASWYVGKYLGKALTVQAWPKGLRRIRTSHNWPDLDTPPQYTKAIVEWTLQSRNVRLEDVDKWAVSTKRATGFPVEIIIG